MLYFVITNPKDETLCIYCTLRSGMSNRMERFYVHFTGAKATILVIDETGRLAAGAMWISNQLSCDDKEHIRILTPDTLCESHAHEDRVVEIYINSQVSSLAPVDLVQTRCCFWWFPLERKEEYIMAGVGVKRVRVRGHAPQLDVSWRCNNCDHTVCSLGVLLTPTLTDKNNKSSININIWYK